QGPQSEFWYTENMVVWFNKQRSIMTLYSGGQAGLFDSTCMLDLSRKVEEEILSCKLLYPSLAFPFSTKPIPISSAHRDDPKSLGICWKNEEFSKGSYSSWGVGQFSLFNATEEHNGEMVRKVFRPISNQIFFAGEHTALEYPATMEGAVDSGERAARMIK